MGKKFLICSLLACAPSAHAGSFFCHSHEHTGVVPYVVAMSDPYVTKAPHPQIVLINEASATSVGASYEQPSSGLFSVDKFSFTLGDQQGVFTVSEVSHTGGCSRLNCDFGSKRNPTLPDDPAQEPQPKHYVGELELNQTVQYYDCN